MSAGGESTAMEIQKEPILTTKTETLLSATTGDAFEEGLLKLYYDFMFPYDLYISWLSYWGGCGSKLWTNREFSFTKNVNGNEIYMRYKSFDDQKMFQKALKDYIPHKIDIGGVFNKKPRLKNQVVNLVVEEREIVFDIDISDYDDVRTCCQDKGICDKCWPLMGCSIKCLNEFLRKDFGFEALMFVFSGRRGIHCWVCDEESRSMDSKIRSSIISYLSITTAYFDEEPTEINDMIQRSYDICLPYFEHTSLEIQQILGNPDNPIPQQNKRLDKLINMVRDKEIRAAIHTQCQILDRDVRMTSTQKWTTIKAIFEDAIKKTKYPFRLRLNLIEIVLIYTYPRLDVEVTRHKNHLLKSPYCVHPKTGKLCVTIDPEKCDEFSPMTVPTLRSLKDELDEAFVSRGIDFNDPKAKNISWRQIPSLKKELGNWNKNFLNQIQSHERHKEDMNMEF